MRIVQAPPHARAVHQTVPFKIANPLQQFADSTYKNLASMEKKGKVADSVIRSSASNTLEEEKNEGDARKGINVFSSIPSYAVKHLILELALTSDASSTMYQGPNLQAKTKVMQHIQEITANS